MRKCKCGAKVHLNDSDAVIVYDRQGKNIIRVICAGCAVGRPPKIKESVLKKEAGENWKDYGERAVKHIDIMEDIDY